MRVYWILLITIILFPLICHADKGTPDIKIHKISNSNYRLTLTSATVKDLDDAQRVLLPDAQILCGDKGVQFGHYKFNSREPLDTSTKAERRESNFVLEQDITCSMPVVETAIEPNLPDLSWRPSDANQNEVEHLSYQFFTATDSGGVMASYVLMEPDMKSGMPIQDWQNTLHKFDVEAGPALTRRIVKITWYKDPPSAPALGVYAKVDYIGKFKNINIYCGFLVWHQQSDGSFLLIRQEKNFITKDMEKKMTISQIAEVKTEFGCPSSP